MKKMMMFLGLLLAVCFSCKKQAGTAFSLQGVYTENSPASGRSQLNFASNSLVIKTETGSAYKDSFYYTIGAEQITLKHYGAVDNTASGFYFHQYNADSFKIANLYASIPEAPPSYMTYKK